MRRPILWIVLLTLVAGTTPAQTEKPVEIYLATGAAYPTNDFNLQYNYGFNGSVGVGLRIANSLRVVPKAEIQTFSIDPNYFVDTVSGGNYTAIMTGADLRWFSDLHKWWFDPILLVGGGLAFARVSTLTVGEITYYSHNETKLYFNIGAGVDMRMTPKISAFITGRYVRISTGGTKTEFFPVSVGMRF